jgi:hypothetical protein
VGRKLLRFLLSLVWEDLALKLFCLILAVMLWFYIDGELTNEVKLRVSAPAGELRVKGELELAEPGQSYEFEVVVRGPRRRVVHLTSRNIRLNLDRALPEPALGTNRARVQPEFLQVLDAPGVTVVDVQPREFSVELLQLLRRRLPVQPRIVGSPALGYLRKQATAEPAEVEVAMALPQGAVLPKFIWTEPVDIQDRTTDLRAQTTLVREMEADGAPVKLRCEERITVRVSIGRDEVDVALKDAPVRALAPPGAALAVEPRTVLLSARGAPNDVAGLRGADVPVYVEWPAEWTVPLPPGPPPSKSVQVKVIAPPRVTISGPNDGALPTVKITALPVRP